MKIQVNGFKGKVVSEIKELASLSPKRLMNRNDYIALRDNKADTETTIRAMLSLYQNLFGKWKKDPTKAFIIKSGKNNSFNVVTFECKERKDVKFNGRKVYEAFNDKTEHGFQLLYTDHAIERFFKRSIVEGEPVYSDFLKKSYLNTDYDRHIDAFMAYATRINTPIIEHNGQHLGVVYDRKISTCGSLVELKIGYLPLDIDFKRGIAIARTLLSVGMKGTPEYDFLKEKNPKILRNIELHSDNYEIINYLETFSEFKGKYKRVPNKEKFYVYEK